MHKIKCVCRYCGDTWEREMSLYAWKSGEFMLTCFRCKDTNIGVKEVTEKSSDIFGYRFSPAFEKKEPVVVPPSNYSQTWGQYAD